ncbi:TIGR02594 family protein [Bradyrhizobium jicamae]|uniref:TIGR02594 family protein n=1 Tax=Bradyrhizobium jicamae TaxID=280332 RepID=A0ABS5FJN3_9BRAD|nr:TIGR02594 family protein [Bradyrhizobium jicamae]MBR0796899.1 TIGR02594 family protein [Bradyrhizobium jicamae]MBR0935321.1 TIGR02594 family protein [Bradyrhizobium jicamae]
MVPLLAYRRSLRVVALALCSLTLAVVCAAPASARPAHSRHARPADAGTRARHHASRRHRHVGLLLRGDRGDGQMQTPGFADPDARVPNTGGVTETSGFGSSGIGIVAEARRYLGGNPTSRRSLWCARFMNMVLKESGYRGTGSDMASSFAHYGQRVSGPQVGAIAVMGRRGGGHVGIITGIDARGNPIMISGNNGNRVREAPVSRGRIYAYVMPN